MARHSSPITTHSQSKKLSRKTLTNQLEALQACLSALEITNQDLRGSNQELQGLVSPYPSDTPCSYIAIEEATRAKEDLRDATKQDTHPGGDLIPCPHGSPGDHCRGYILITELGLEGNYRFYMGLRVRILYFRAVYMILKTYSASREDHHATCWI
jgi:hypothetical protein